MFQIPLALSTWSCPSFIRQDYPIGQTLEMCFICRRLQGHNRSLTRSSKMSLWCTWMVMSVSNFVRSTFVSSLVVCSIRTFNNSKNAVLVCCITFLSYLAFVSASVESLVHIIWIPSRPTYKQNLHKLLSGKPIAYRTRVTELKQLLRSRPKTNSHHLWTFQSIGKCVTIFFRL